VRSIADSRRYNTARTLCSVTGRGNNMMADDQLFNDNDDGVGGGVVFVYTGGDQEVPRDVKQVRIAENIDTIPANTFEGCEQLIEVKGHNRLRKVEQYAFRNCPFLRSLTKMQVVKEIEKLAFYNCPALSELEFDKLEIIGDWTFSDCRSLRSISMPSIRRVGAYAFADCGALTDIAFGQDLERIEEYTFYQCRALSRVDFIGGIHKTISSLHFKTWRGEMQDEIDSINQSLYIIPEKTTAIQQWITRVLSRMERYRTEHNALLKEAMTLLELALWKAKLLNEVEEEKCNVAKKARINAEATRKEHRVTCGASIVIKNVLPFLALK
jgi:flagellar capping protein FliD